MEPYEILTGVGTLYVAPVGTVFPDLDDNPSATWRNLGNTQDGVKVTLDQKIDEHSVDQETGAVKASRSEESLVLETSLAEATLENLADVIGATLIDTPAGVGTIGTREVPLYKGANVKTFAFLFRDIQPTGISPRNMNCPMDILVVLWNWKIPKKAIGRSALNFTRWWTPLQRSMPINSGGWLCRMLRQLHE